MLLLLGPNHQWSRRLLPIIYSVVPSTIALQSIRSGFHLRARSQRCWVPDRVMCHCLSFLAYPYPSISQRWASWKRELLRRVDRIVSYNGPFTGFQVQRISIQGSLTSYSSTGARVHLTLTMGTCMSSSSSSSSSSTSTIDGGGGGAAQNKILSAKRKQQQLLVVQDLAAPTPPSTAPSKRPRDKIRTEATESAPSSVKEIRVPKKVCANGASNFACLFSQQGRKGLNQDAMIVWEDFGCQEDAVFCGVFDGHGPFGHLVAQCVRDLLPPKLASNLQTCSNASAQGPMFEASKYDEKGANKGSIKDTEGCQIDSKLFSVWKESFLNAYMLMDKELQKKPNVNCYCSGTTAVTLVKQGNDVIIGNVGDSRAVLGTKSDEGSLIAVQLTVDLKPNLPQEAERIRQCRGRVFALQDEPDVHRVWLPHDNSPGLAMARAFGDFCLKNFGVIAVPEVTHHRLTDRDQFIVLATDGIWDVLSNEEVVDIVSSVSARPLAARTVVEMAVLAWRSKFPTSKVDDCAVVCLFTNDILAVPSAQSFLKRSMLATRRKRSVSAVSLKLKTTECSDVSTSKVSQCTVLPSIKAGMSGMSHSQSEQSEGIFKAEVDVASQNFTEVEPIQKLSCESLGKPLKSPPNQAGNLVNAEVESDRLLEAGQREEWSALDGVTRVNSLVNLPRFTPGDARGGG